MDATIRTAVDASVDGGSVYDVIVLGAGISGLVSASLLLQKGYRRILLVDEYSHAGGNHIDLAVGAYTFDVGSYIFQDDSPLLVHFPELLDLYVPIEPRWGRLNPQGRVTRYPISIKDDIVAAGPIEWIRMVLSVLYSRVVHRRLRNARDFARYWIGSRLLHRSGLRNYMERFYGLPPEQIDIKFAEKRMLWIKEHASLTFPFRRLLRSAAPAGPQNRQLARPREGFAHLYRRATEGLEQRGVTFLFNTTVRALRKEDGRFHLSSNRGNFVCDRLVSTIPLASISTICSLPAPPELISVTLISLFFSFSGERGFADSILYNFSHQGAWKRLTVYSDFYGLSAGREFFAAEVNADHVRGSVEVAEQDFRQHVRANGLFRGDLKLEGSHTLANAYPIYTDRADERAARVIADLRALGVESFGRQGGFDYQPTARDSTLKTEAALRDD